MKLRHGLLSLFAFALLATSVVLLAPGCGGSKKSATAPGVTTSTVTGVVSDAGTGSLLTAASVKTSLGGTTTTDAQGRFTLSVPANTNFRLDVTRSDYSLNQVVLQLTAGQTKSLAVSLIPAGSSAAVPVAAGGKVTDASSGATLTLPANFVTASGPVTVRVTGLDPTTSEVKALPGGLDAVDANGHAVFLKPVSFAEYTVTDASGNVLPFNTSASAGANIELPIPASLRGQAGYQNGDPIECYVYDPSDGKWKTPVPGVVGPSSVDGTTPAIKATIFHLSWYGGAPASSQIGCVEGTVRLNGTPVANCDIEAYPGGSTRTDANGHYQVQAAANSVVRVDASLLSGTTFRTAEGSVSVGVSGVTCAHLDLSLGAATSGQYTVLAFLSKETLGTSSDIFDVAVVTLEVGTNATQIPVAGAKVQIGTGGNWFTLADESNGGYSLATGTASFALNGGAPYSLRIDFTNDGTWDATGSVTMTDLAHVTAPAESSTVGKSFTATWTDPSHGVSGYAPIYFATIAGDTTAQAFATTQLSYAVGNGVTDAVTHLPNPPLSAGMNTLVLISGAGPTYEILAGGSFLPNVSGTNVTGYFDALSFDDNIVFTSTGVTNHLLAGRPTRAWQPPVRRTPALERALAEVHRVKALVAAKRSAAAKSLRAHR